MFIPVKSTYKIVNIADIFMKEIFKLHGVPKVIVLIDMQNLQEILQEISRKLCLKG